MNKIKVSWNFFAKYNKSQSWFLWTLAKSVHFKKRVAQCLFLSKLWYFSIQQQQQQVPQFWKKWGSPFQYTILAKERFGHSDTFWAMPIMIFSPVANFGDQSLIFNSKKKQILWHFWLFSWHFFTTLYRKQTRNLFSLICGNIPAISLKCYNS